MFEGLLGAGASILGGLLGKSSADAAREQQSQMAAQNIQLQREFAQKGIQWKVDDAKAAGIHPLYALGASTHSFSPVSVGNTADNSLGEGISRAGQNIERAFSANADRETRALQLKSLQADVEGKGLANEIARAELASKVARLGQPGNPPGVSLAGVPHKVQEPEFTKQRAFFGLPLSSHPGFSDNNTEQNRIGEGADVTGGLLVWPADLSHSVRPFIGNLPSNIVDALAAREWEKRGRGDRSFRSPSSHYYTPF